MIISQIEVKIQVDHLAIKHSPLSLFKIDTKVLFFQNALDFVIFSISS